jgi:hypothetical protein
MPQTGRLICIDEIIPEQQFVKIQKKPSVTKGVFSDK